MSVKWQKGDRVPEGYAIAMDGLPARVSGAWAREKLAFLDKYVGPAIQATKRKGGYTHYIDLFAGPGWNIVCDKSSGRVEDQFPGSPILALESEFPSKAGPLKFQHFHFFNRSELDYELLRTRVATSLKRMSGAVDPDNVHHYYGDSNDRIHDVLQRIPNWAYLFVFADIEGPGDLAFETIRAMRARHDSVDFYSLFPTGYLDRVLAYDPEERRRHETMWDQFFGTTEWLSIVGRRYTSSQAVKMRGELLQLYREQLTTIWQHADIVTTITREGQRVLYHMVFAHDHPAARSIFKWASGKLQQLDFFGRTR